MTRYEWINDPPIEEIALRDVQAVVRRFRESLDYVKSHADEIGAGYAAKAHAGDDIISPVQEMWNSSMKQALGTRAKQHVYGYKLDGQYVGLIHVTMESDHVYIDHVVGHPGTENAGDILIEYVLGLSPSSPPKVKLFAATDAAANRYLELGFVFQTNGSTRGGMTLDLSTPAGRAKWRQVGAAGRWKRAEYVDKGYLRNASA